MPTHYPLRLPASAPVVTLTHPSPTLWVLELHNGDDSRITYSLVHDAVQPALDAVEADWRAARRAVTGGEKEKEKDAGAGALVIVGKRGQDKFFSNGLDFVNTSKDMAFFQDTFNPMAMRILTFPIPTIAAINGHCFAGGFLLAMCCDYRVMTDGSKRRAWASMNEVHFGAPWPLSFAAVFRAKVGDARTVRKIALEGHRFTPQEALGAGIVDHVVGGDTEAVIAAAAAIGQSVGGLAKGGVWGLIKTDLYREVLEASSRDLRTITAQVDDTAFFAKAKL